MHSEDWARQSATCGSGPASERPRTESLKKDFCHVRRKNPKEDRNPSTWKQIFQLKSAYVCVYVRCVTACVWVWVGVGGCVWGRQMQLLPAVGVSQDCQRWWTQVEEAAEEEKEVKREKKTSTQSRSETQTQAAESEMRMWAKDSGRSWDQRRKQTRYETKTKLKLECENNRSES